MTDITIREFPVVYLVLALIFFLFFFFQSWVIGLGACSKDP